MDIVKNGFNTVERFLLTVNDFLKVNGVNR